MAGLGRCNLRSAFVLTVVLAGGPFVGSGCTGSRDGAAEQLRSAIASDGVPAQYEPPVEASQDQFEPVFDD